MSKNPRKNPIYLPYTRKIDYNKSRVKFEYNGGVCDTKWKYIHSIMFYGKVCPLEDDFLDSCRRFNIPICIHRRYIKSVTWILPSQYSSSIDLLTKQIKFRENKKKRPKIARSLLEAKFKSMEWLVENTMELKGIFDINHMRIIESMHAKKYWYRYYKNLGYPEYSRRGDPNIVKSVLDASSKFIVGILLRWIFYHKLSPFHGFLHSPTDYPSLAYDLIEPYRGYIEKCIFDTIKKLKDEKVDESEFLAYSIQGIKNLLNEKIYVHPTRQIVTFQELLHGSVLSLRSYLLGASNRFIIPIPAKPNGGRPVKSGYKLYGRSAGPTDFWEEAKRVSNNIISSVD